MFRSATDLYFSKGKQGKTVAKGLQDPEACATNSSTRLQGLCSRLLAASVSVLDRLTIEAVLWENRLEYCAWELRYEKGNI